MDKTNPIDVGLKSPVQPSGGAQFDAMREKLKAREKQAEEDRLSTWRDLVSRSATDAELDPDQVIATLERLGKSVEELEAAVVVFKKRETLQARIATHDQARQEYREAVAAHDALNPEFDELRRRQSDARERVQRAEGKLTSIRNAQEQLGHLEPELRKAGLASR